MSKFSHRQPIWTWSSVVLLSTILLSPVTANTLLRALAQTLPQQNAGTSTPADAGRTAADNRGANTPAPAEQRAPRRTADEGEAIRAAARIRQLRAIRFDDDPEQPASAATLAFVLPERSVLSIPDDDALASLFAADPVAPPRAGALRDTPPRAPPAQA
jgi:hypothetical protein